MSNDYNTVRKNHFCHYFLIPLLLKKLKKVYIRNRLGSMIIPIDTVWSLREGTGLGDMVLW